MMTTLGLYVHIPFCRQKCLYCDFPSYSHLESLYEAYVVALCRQIRVQGALLSHYTVDTVYIGGGTPTLLPLSMLRDIIECLKDSFVLDNKAEISIEANPGTVDYEVLSALHESGINRISFGVQTFNDAQLMAIGRIHSAAAGVTAVTMARQAGFDNVNLDLMYGLPGQTVADVKANLKTALSLNVDHLSVYGLKIEAGTPFAAAYDQGQLILPDEDVEDEMYELINHYLPNHGFGRYEISNYARPGRECRHNLKYWHYQPYLGLGAAAHSFMGQVRTAATADVAKYIKLIQAGESVIETSEHLDRPTAMAEFTFLALRTAAGLKFSDFYDYFTEDFTSHYARQLDWLARRQLIAVTAERIYLTARGMKYGNIVFESFLPEKA